MRKRILALVLTAALLGPVSRPSSAGIPIPVATELTQLLNHAQLLMQYVRQAQQLVSAVNQERMMIQNLKQLNIHSFGNIANDINNLATIVQGGRAIAYSMGNIDQLFQMTFPGYTTFGGGNSYFRQYAKWSQTSLDTTLGALRAAGMQAQQMTNEQVLLHTLQNQASSSTGAMEALQVMGEISEQQVQQLQKLRQLMMADLSSKQAFQAADIQDKAAERAASEHFFTAPINVLSDNRTFDPVR